jgi:hypothetical protein
MGKTKEDRPDVRLVLYAGGLADAAERERFRRSVMEGANWTSQEVDIYVRGVALANVARKLMMDEGVHSAIPVSILMRLMVNEIMAATDPSGWATLFEQLALDIMEFILGAAAALGVPPYPVKTEETVH